MVLWLLFVVFSLIGWRLLAGCHHCKLLQLTFDVIGHALGKLQGKGVTDSEEVGWWRTLMVECVTRY